jgi:hypothetical protein
MEIVLPRLNDDARLSLSESGVCVWSASAGRLSTVTGLIDVRPDDNAITLIVGSGAYHFSLETLPT